MPALGDTLGMGREHRDLIAVADQAASEVANERA
jgi:hypothetical protein